MILQFGAGNFLRAFIDLFVSEAAFDYVFVVQSTGRDRALALNRAQGRYHVAIQGISDAALINRTVEVSSIRRAVYAESDWSEVGAVASRADLRWIVSNTTEAGFVLDYRDSVLDGVPFSFPAKLLSVLLRRYEAGLPGVMILPCELIEENGERLLELVLSQAARWNVSPAAIQWLREECRWVNSLVDRIVPGPPKDHPLKNCDPLLLSAEPYALWAVEAEPPFPLRHSAIAIVPDIRPFALRKIRILNGLHSALVCRALPMGISTVQDAMEHSEIGAWLEELMMQEIVPVLEGRVPDPVGFGRAVLERFRNPFLEHKLASIALNHQAKVNVRLRPTAVEYRAMFGREPRILSALL